MATIEELEARIAQLETLLEGSVGSNDGVVIESSVNDVKTSSVDIASVESDKFIKVSEQDSVIEGHKKEYSIVGDGLYASVNTEKAPQWLLSIVDSVVSSSMSSSVSSIDDVRTTILSTLEDIVTEANAYAERIDSEITDNEVIVSRLDSLDATVGDNSADILSLTTTYATDDYVSAIAADVLSASLDDGDIKAQINTINTAIAEERGARADSIETLTTVLNDPDTGLIGKAEAQEEFATFVGYDTDSGSTTGSGLLDRITATYFAIDGDGFSDAPSSNIYESDGTTVLTTMPNYRLVDNVLQTYADSTWSDATELAVDDSDTLTVVSVDNENNTLDYTMYEYNSGAWTEITPGGLVARSSWAINLDAWLGDEDSDATYGGQSSLKSTLDTTSDNIKSEFRYDSDISINGNTYTAGFGIANEALVEGSTTEYSSEFWINANAFKLVDTDNEAYSPGDTIDSPFSVVKGTDDVWRAQFNGVVSFNSVDAVLAGSSQYDNSEVVIPEVPQPEDTVTSADLPGTTVKNPGTIWRHQVDSTNEPTRYVHYISTGGGNWELVGGTYIDGSNIVTGTIDAARLDVNSIFASDITATGTITGATLEGAVLRISDLHLVTDAGQDTMLRSNVSSSQGGNTSNVVWEIYPYNSTIPGVYKLAKSTDNGILQLDTTDSTYGSLVYKAFSSGTSNYFITFTISWSIDGSIVATETMTKNYLGATLYSFAGSTLYVTIDSSGHHYVYFKEGKVGLSSLVLSGNGPLTLSFTDVSYTSGGTYYNSSSPVDGSHENIQ